MSTWVPDTKLSKMPYPRGSSRQWERETIDQCVKCYDGVQFKMFQWHIIRISNDIKAGYRRGALKRKWH